MKLSKREIKRRAWMEVYGMLESHLGCDSDFAQDRDSEEHAAVRAEIDRITQFAFNKAKSFESKEKRKA